MPCSWPCYTPISLYIVSVLSRGSIHMGTSAALWGSTQREHCRESSITLFGVQQKLTWFHLLNLWLAPRLTQGLSHMLDETSLCLKMQFVTTISPWILISWVDPSSRILYQELTNFSTETSGIPFGQLSLKITSYATLESDSARTKDFT